MTSTKISSYKTFPPYNKPNKITPSNSSRFSHPSMFGCVEDGVKVADPKLLRQLYVSTAYPFSKTAVGHNNNSSKSKSSSGGNCVMGKAKKLLCKVKNRVKAAYKRSDKKIRVIVRSKWKNPIECRKMGFRVHDHDQMGNGEASYGCFLGTVRRVFACGTKVDVAHKVAYAYA